MYLSFMIIPKPVARNGETLTNLEMVVLITSILDLEPNSNMRFDLFLEVKIEFGKRQWQEICQVRKSQNSVTKCQVPLIVKPLT